MLVEGHLPSSHCRSVNVRRWWAAVLPLSATAGWLRFLMMCVPSCASYIVMLRHGTNTEHVRDLIYSATKMAQWYSSRLRAIYFRKT